MGGKCEQIPSFEMTTLAVVLRVTGTRGQGRMLEKS